MPSYEATQANVPLPLIPPDSLLDPILNVLVAPFDMLPVVPSKVDRSMMLMELPETANPTLPLLPFMAVAVTLLMTVGLLEIGLLMKMP